VAINTAAINNPKLITDGAKAFGSQCIVVSIEAKGKGNGKYEAYTDNGREKTGVDVFEWARRAADMGAGEIMVTSIDHEGTGRGYDIELLSRVSNSVSIPVIACGGAGNKGHFLEAIVQGDADAVCAASVFHYCQLRKNIDDSRFKEEGNIEYLKSQGGNGGAKSTRMDLIGISDVKDYLMEHGVRCRIH
jgi:cyclase